MSLFIQKLTSQPLNILIMQFEDEDDDLFNFDWILTSLEENQSQMIFFNIEYKVY